MEERPVGPDFRDPDLEESSRPNGVSPANRKRAPPDRAENPSRSSAAGRGPGCGLGAGPECGPEEDMRALSAQTFVSLGLSTREGDGSYHNSGNHGIRNGPRQATFTPSFPFFGRCSRYDETFDEQGNVVPGACFAQPRSYGENMFTSPEFAGVVKDHYLVIAAQQKRFKLVRKRLQPGGPEVEVPMYVDIPGLRYTVVKSPMHLVNLYRQIPPADRHFQEAITPYTPHKCVMDIERDAPEGSGDAFISRMRGGMHRLFIPLLARYFREELGIASAARGSFCVTDSSKAGEKFSVHVVVTTPENHYFRNREEARVVMSNMVMWLYRRALEDEGFHDWFLFTEAEEGGEEKTVSVMDLGVYGRGQRNMRLIGSCKAKRATATKWTDCRVFMPCNGADHLGDAQGADFAAESDQRGRPFTDFIATVERRLEGDTAVPVGRPIILDRAVVTATLRAEEAFNEPWFFKLRHGGGALSSTTQRVERGVHTGQADARGDWATAAASGILRPRHVIDAWKKLKAEARAQWGRETVAMELYYTAAVDRFNHVVSQIPLEVRAHGTVTFVNGAALKPRRVFGKPGCQSLALVEERVPRTSFAHPEGRRRFCPLGCAGAGHDAYISVMPDLSVRYYCNNCKGRVQIANSPFLGDLEAWPTDMEDREEIPADFREGLVEYTERFMRRIGRVPGESGPTTLHRKSGLGLRERAVNAPDLRRTVILQGGMGCGKTFTTKAFLEEVRAEFARPGQDPSDVRVIAISFRQMLADMFARSFGLRCYRQLTTEQILVEKNLSIQVDSLPRLLRRFPDGRMLLDAAPDVVIIDEIESVLSHFASSTVDFKRSLCWRVLLVLGESASCLIAADQDMGPRSFEFLRMTRGARGQAGYGPHSGQVPIRNLEFHVNRSNKCKLHFIDYLYESAWFSRLVDSLCSGKNVYVFFNHKKRMHAIRECLVNEIHKRRVEAMRREQETGALSPEDKLLLNTLSEGKVLVIDADVTSAEKRKHANECNEEWSRHSIVMVTPTVGAGIDFTEVHFHEAFGWAYNQSNSARGFNQMRGRVRELIDGKVHLYIQDRCDDSLKSDLRSEAKDRAANELSAPAEKRKLATARRVQEAREQNALEAVARECRTAGPAVTEEEIEQAHARQSADLETSIHALSISDAVRNQRLRTFNTRRDNERRAAMAPAQGEHINLAHTEPTDLRLNTIMFFNNIEKSRSNQCFRRELISILRAQDPDLHYVFNLDRGRGDLEARTLEAEQGARDRWIVSVSAQPMLCNEEMVAVAKEVRGVKRRAVAWGGDLQGGPSAAPAAPAAPGGGDDDASESHAPPAPGGDYAGYGTYGYGSDDDDDDDDDGGAMEVDEDALQTQATQATQGLLDDAFPPPPWAIPLETKTGGAKVRQVEKKAVASFYGIRQTGVAPEVFEQLYRIGGTEFDREAVRAAFFVLCADEERLAEEDQERGQGLSFEAGVEGGVSSTHVVPQVGDKERVRPLSHIRSWMRWLLYLGGFDVKVPWELDDGQCLIPGIGCGFGHRKLSAARLKEKPDDENRDPQKWLKEHAQHIVETAGVRSPGKLKEMWPKHGGDWDQNKVWGLIAKVFQSKFGLALSRSGPGADSGAEAAGDDDETEAASCSTATSSARTELWNLCFRAGDAESARALLARISRRCGATRPSAGGGGGGGGGRKRRRTREPARAARPLAACPGSPGNACTRTARLFSASWSSLAIFFSLVFMYGRAKWLSLAGDEARETPARKAARTTLEALANEWKLVPAFNDFLEVPLPGPRLCAAPMLVGILRTWETAQEHMDNVREAHLRSHEAISRFVERNYKLCIAHTFAANVYGNGTVAELTANIGRDTPYGAYIARKMSEQERELGREFSVWIDDVRELIRAGGGNEKKGKKLRRYLSDVAG